MHDMPIIKTDVLHWEDASSEIPGSRYLASVAVGSLPMHLEARRVEVDPDTDDGDGDGWVVGFTEWPEDLEALEQLYSDTRMRTATPVELGIADLAASGRYLVFSYPYGH